MGKGAIIAIVISVIFILCIISIVIGAIFYNYNSSNSQTSVQNTNYVPNDFVYIEEDEELDFLPGDEGLDFLPEDEGLDFLPEDQENIAISVNNGNVAIEGTMPPQTTFIVNGETYTEGLLPGMPAEDEFMQL